MPAFLVLLIAVLSRLFPHALGGVGLDITAVGGSLLFFGAHRPRREFLLAAATLAATDIYLTTAVFGYPFHLRDYVLTWLWYAAVPLLGRTLLARSGSHPHPTLTRTAAAVLASATSFFLLSNLSVFALGTLYPHSLAGLLACFAAALPFFGNDLAATALTAGILFGLPALARQLFLLSRKPA